jgi:hypothetical protein
MAVTDLVDFGRSAAGWRPSGRQPQHFEGDIQRFYFRLQASLAE